MTHAPTVLKAGSPEAGERVGKFHGFAAELPDRSDEPQPSDREIELEALRANLNAAERAKDALDAHWRDQFELKLAAARAEIIQQRNAYEQKKIEELQAALQHAQQRFESSLSTVREEAVAIACFGLERLAAVRDDDRAFLASCIEQRMSEISDALVVSLSVSPRDESLRDYFAASLNRKGLVESRIKLDESLPPGTARIDLLVGDIPIVPGHGLATIISVAKGEGTALHG